MTELNESALRDALNRLPRRKAGGWLWEEIRWQMNKPLAGNLPVHTAPERVWQQVQAATGIARKKAGVWFALFSSLLLILFTLWFYPLNFPENSEHHASGRNMAAAGAKSGTKPVSEEFSTNSVPGKAPETLQITFPALQQKTKVLKPEAIQGHAAVPASSSGSQAACPELNRKLPLFLPEKSAYIRSGPDPELTCRSSTKAIGQSPLISAGSVLFLYAAYIPQFLSSDLISSPVQNFSFGTGSVLGKFRVSIGGGLTRFSRDTEISYEYRRNELVYSYNYVDSVYIDPDTHVTYYYTTNVEVYDSVDHTLTETMHSRYSYLQLPVSLSYRFAQAGKLALSVQATAVYHLLENYNRNFNTFSVESSRLMSTTIQEHELSSAFWSLGGGLLMEYDAGRRIGFSLSPGFNFHFLKIPDNPRKGMPAFGLEFGLYYKIISG